MKNESKRNSFTGTLMRKPSGDILNSLTGQYRQADESTGKRVSKRDEAIWPSISQREDPEPQPQPQSEPVRKSTSENPFPSLTAHLGQDSSENFEMTVPFFAAIEKSADEHIVYGIVYEPDTEDAQGDQANAEEIKKAAYGFMENNPVFKIMHKGKSVKVKILESYIAPTSFTIEKRKVKKGSWILVTRINDKGLWKDIKSGKFTGYSMAGTARSS